MSLDVYLEIEGVQHLDGGEHIFIREDGQNKEISRAEWDELYPDRDPVTVTFPDETNEVYSANITHNLNKMADAAGLYQALWCPDENGITKAKQLIPILASGLENLRADPEHYKWLNPPNGWGCYEGLVNFVKCYLNACEEYPEALVRVSR